MRSTITARGQTVIPAADRLEWLVENNNLRVVPVRKNPIDAFRGKGTGGAVERLLADRRKDRESE